jgi:hypothetical protein
MISVPKAQAAWAYYLLQQGGVPILYAPEGVVSAPQRQDDPIDTIFNFLDNL